MSFDAIVEHMPGWFFVIAAIIILLGILITAFIPALGVYRLVKSIYIEKELIELQKQVHNLSRENEYNENKSLKLLTVIENSRLFLNAINNNNHDEVFIYMYVQRIIESLAADIKTKAGEKHRCGFWSITDDRRLKLLNGSSGFPDHYFNSRFLNLDSSIAGRSFRKNILINSPNVKDDHDYEHSESDYASLICVPVGSFGVLTIDGKEPFDKSAESVAELYASIIELTINLLAFSDYQTVEAKIASTTIKEEGE